MRNKTPYLFLVSSHAPGRTTPFFSLSLRNGFSSPIICILCQPYIAILYQSAYNAPHPHSKLPARHQPYPLQMSSRVPHRYILTSQYIRCRGLHSAHQNDPQSLHHGSHPTSPPCPRLHPAQDTREGLESTPLEGPHPSPCISPTHNLPLVHAAAKH